MSLAAAAQEGGYFINVLNSLGITLPRITIYEDNQGAIELTKITKNHSRTKHIDVRYHFIKDLIKTDKITVTHIGTKEMQADMFTKALSSPQFIYLRNKIGVSSVSDQVNVLKDDPIHS